MSRQATEVASIAEFDRGVLAAIELVEAEKYSYYGVTLCDADSLLIELRAMLGKNDSKNDTVMSLPDSGLHQIGHNK